MSSILKTFGEVQKAVQKLSPSTKEEFKLHNDAANGLLFASVFGDICRYNATAKSWWIYDGTVWKADVSAVHAQRYAEMLYKALYYYAGTCDSDYQKTIFPLGNVEKRKKMLEDARKHKAFTSDELDIKNNLLNLKNGTLNLETLELSEHNPENLLSKCANVVYDPNVSSDTFATFVNDIMCGDAEKMRYLQKAAALGITCDTSREEAYLLYGATSRNGKSTFLETIGYMLGGYAMNMQPESLAMRKKDGRQASGDIARLSGCRFLRMSEPPKGMRFDEALLKSILGRDALTARNLYEGEFEFIPVFTLFINTNYLPVVADDTVFKSGRLKVISFDRHFEEQEQDKGLKDRLRQSDNLSGAFNWILEGLKLYREEGLLPPQAVTEATQEYQNSSDKVTNFIDECLVENSTGTLAASEVYHTYSTWCKECGYMAESKKTLFEAFRKRGMLYKTGTVRGRTIKNVIKGYLLSDDTEPLEWNP